jgi:CopG family nickel-responsive transcriptional regulator
MGLWAWCEIENCTGAQRERKKNLEAIRIPYDLRFECMERLLKRRRTALHGLFLVHDRPAQACTLATRTTPMAAELIRFGVAMDADLLARFDEHIARRGYATRSEALRDLVRAELAAAHVAGGGLAAATLTLVYDHHVRELTEKLTAMQHELGEKVISTLHVHLDHDHCLEVIVLRGPAAAIQAAADRILATKGVKHGKLVMTAFPQSHDDDHGPHGKHRHEHR